MVGLAALILVIGVTYWLIRDQDEDLPSVKSGAVPEGARAEAYDPPY
jgi:hypothetical protein